MLYIPVVLPLFCSLNWGVTGCKQLQAIRSPTDRMHHNTVKTCLITKYYKPHMHVNRKINIPIPLNILMSDGKNKEN